MTWAVVWAFLLGGLYGMGCTFATYFWTMRKSR